MEMAKANEFSHMANVGDTNFLEKARAWDRRDVHRLICVCDICRNAGRMEELRDIALNALDASRNAKASYAVFMRIARFLEECSDYPAAREALSCAAPLARNRIEEEEQSLWALFVQFADADGGAMYTYSAYGYLNDFLVDGKTPRQGLTTSPTCFQPCANSGKHTPLPSPRE